jgi:hypothetical protein
MEVRDSQFESHLFIHLAATSFVDLANRRSVASRMTDKAVINL